MKNVSNSYKRRNNTAKLKADVPILEGTMAKSWGKEDELKQLKSELDALDRKIAAEVAPTHEVPDDRMGVNHDEKDGEEVKTDTQQQQPGKVIEAHPSPQSQPADDKKSMVAEPNYLYRGNNITRYYTHH